eukprot:jgi/Ulvmu1/3844/UM018_0060.1
MADFVIDDDLLQELFSDEDGKENPATCVKQHHRQPLPSAASHAPRGPVYVQQNAAYDNKFRGITPPAAGSRVRQVRNDASVSARGRADQLSTAVPGFAHNVSVRPFSHHNFNDGASRQGDCKPVGDISTHRTPTGLQAPVWHQQVARPHTILPAQTTQIPARHDLGVNMAGMSCSVAAPSPARGPSWPSIQTATNAQQRDEADCRSAAQRLSHSSSRPDGTLGPVAGQPPGHAHTVQPQASYPHMPMIAYGTSDTARPNICSHPRPGATFQAQQGFHQPDAQRHNGFAPSASARPGVPYSGAAHMQTPPAGSTADAAAPNSRGQQPQSHLTPPHYSLNQSSTPSQLPQRPMMQAWQQRPYRPPPQQVPAQPPPQRPSSRAPPLHSMQPSQPMRPHQQQFTEPPQHLWPQGPSHQPSKPMQPLQPMQPQAPTQHWQPTQPMRAPQQHTREPSQHPRIHPVSMLPTKPVQPRPGLPMQRHPSQASCPAWPVIKPEPSSNPPAPRQQWQQQPPHQPPATQASILQQQPFQAAPQNAHDQSKAVKQRLATNSAPALPVASRTITHAIHDTTTRSLPATLPQVARVQSTLPFSQSRSASAAPEPGQCSAPAPQARSDAPGAPAAARPAAADAAGARMDPAVTLRKSKGPPFDPSGCRSGNAAVPLGRMEELTHWAYPTNREVRDYQLEMAKAGLFHNTLVALPTGLGKTLIAAVIMHNYIRWFPQGKLVFVAPTKPLVEQQRIACLPTLCIDEGRVELMTSKSGKAAARKDLWNDKTVFFCTPQILQNDLKHGLCPAERIVCLVVDECHRAIGDYAAACAVKDICARHASSLRIIGLSATPGSSEDKIQEVLGNVRASRVVFFGEEDECVKKYRHGKTARVIVVRATGAVKRCEDSLKEVQGELLSRLVSAGFLSSVNTELTYFSIGDAFRAASNKGTRPNQAHHALNNQACFMARLLTELRTTGASAGYHHWESSIDPDADKSQNIRALDSMFPCMPQERQRLKSLAARGEDDPKLHELQAVLLEHFARMKREGNTTRAMVFTSLKDGAEHICTALNAMEGGVVMARKFVGQGGGKGKGKGKMSQKEQKAVLDSFRELACNTLVATCIGEEGLDIPEVDLVVCLDVSSSPTRSVQRSGRMGRHRDGCVVHILAAGAEERKYKEAEAKQKQLQELLRHADVNFKLCPRSDILPDAFRPEMKLTRFPTAADESALVPQVRERSEMITKARSVAQDVMNDSAVPKRSRPRTGKSILERIVSRRTEAGAAAPTDAGADAAGAHAAPAAAASAAETGCGGSVGGSVEFAQWGEAGRVEGRGLSTSGGGGRREGIGSAAVSAPAMGAPGGGREQGAASGARRDGAVGEDAQFAAEAASEQQAYSGPAWPSMANTTPQAAQHAQQRCSSGAVPSTAAAPATAVSLADRVRARSASLATPCDPPAAHAASTSALPFVTAPSSYPPPRASAPALLPPGHRTSSAPAGAAAEMPAPRSTSTTPAAQHDAQQDCVLIDVCAEAPAAPAAEFGPPQPRKTYKLTPGGRRAIEYALAEPWLEEMSLAWRGVYQHTCMRYGCRRAPTSFMKGDAGAGGAAAEAPIVIDDDSRPGGACTAEPDVTAVAAAVPSEDVPLAARLPVASHSTAAAAGHKTRADDRGGVGGAAVAHNSCPGGTAHMPQHGAEEAAATPRQVYPFALRNEHQQIAACTAWEDTPLSMEAIVAAVEGDDPIVALAQAVLPAAELARFPGTLITEPAAASQNSSGVALPHTSAGAACEDAGDTAFKRMKLNSLVQRLSGLSGSTQRGAEAHEGVAAAAAGSGSPVGGAAAGRAGPGADTCAAMPAGHDAALPAAGTKRHMSQQAQRDADVHTAQCGTNLPAAAPDSTAAAGAHAAKKARPSVDGRPGAQRGAMHAYAQNDRVAQTPASESAERGQRTPGSGQKTATPAACAVPGGADPSRRADPSPARTAEPSTLLPPQRAASPAQHTSPAVQPQPPPATAPQAGPSRLAAGARSMGLMRLGAKRRQVEDEEEDDAPLQSRKTAARPAHEAHAWRRAWAHRRHAAPADAAAASPLTSSPADSATPAGTVSPASTSSPQAQARIQPRGQPALREHNDERHETATDSHASGAAAAAAPGDGHTASEQDDCGCDQQQRPHLRAGGDRAASSELLRSGRHAESVSEDGSGTRPAPGTLPAPPSSEAVPAPAIAVIEGQPHAADRTAAAMHKPAAAVSPAQRPAVTMCGDAALPGQGSRASAAQVTPAATPAAPCMLTMPQTIGDVIPETCDLDAPPPTNTPAALPGNAGLTTPAHDPPPEHAQPSAAPPEPSPCMAAAAVPSEAPCAGSPPGAGDMHGTDACALPLVRSPSFEPLGENAAAGACSPAALCRLPVDRANGGAGLDCIPDTPDDSCTESQANGGIGSMSRSRPQHAPDVCGGRAARPPPLRPSSTVQDCGGRDARAAQASMVPCHVHDIFAMSPCKPQAAPVLLAVSPPTCPAAAQHSRLATGWGSTSRGGATSAGDPHAPKDGCPAAGTDLLTSATSPRAAPDHGNAAACAVTGAMSGMHAHPPERRSSVSTAEAAQHSTPQRGALVRMTPHHEVADMPAGHEAARESGSKHLLKVEEEEPAGLVAVGAPMEGLIDMTLEDSPEKSPLLAARACVAAAPRTAERTPLHDSSEGDPDSGGAAQRGGTARRKRQCLDDSDSEERGGDGTEDTTGTPESEPSRSISIAEFSGQPRSVSAAPRRVLDSDSPPLAAPRAPAAQPRRTAPTAAAAHHRPRQRRGGCVFVDDCAEADSDGSDDEDDEEDGGSGSDSGARARFVVSTQALVAEARTPVTDERAMYLRSLHTPESSGGRDVVQRMRGVRRR